VTRAFTLAPYHWDVQSLPFWIASATVLAMMAYAGLMRGAPALRYSFLGVCACVLPFVVGYALNSSTNDLEVAEFNARWGTAFTPMAGACVMMFDLALARRLAPFRRLIAIAVVLSLIFAVACISTNWIAKGIWVTPSGIPFAMSGPFGWTSALLIGPFVLVGTVVLWRRLDSEPSPQRRRQYRGAIWAFSIAGMGLVDTLLSYRIGYGPVSWFFLTLGALIALRSLAADDLVHAGSVDRRTLLGVAYVLLAAVGLARFVPGNEPVAAAGAVVLLFLGLRAGAAVTSFLTRADAPADSPLERAFEKYRTEVRGVKSVGRVAELTGEVLELALGVESVNVLVPSAEDYSWWIAGGDPLVEEATPDPRLLGWFVAHGRPTSRDDLITARLGELREPLEQLFDTHRAEIIAPLLSRDELIGLIVLGSLREGRAARPDELALLERVAEQAAAAVVFAGMFREANERVEIDKEVELAAAVQDAFVPGQGARNCARVRVAGRYAPATRCGGDWWSTHALAGGRTLVLVGDVTGHGVAAAMVTAAAKGCYDVALRLMGDDVDLAQLLGHLHRAVRRTGGDQFYMTCFATLIDPGAGVVRFANAGHVVPYVCRHRRSGKPKLDVLVARGNPLGATEGSVYEVHERPIGDGDVIVWYTDGIVECTNPAGQQFGDRRFQRAVRRLACSEELDVDAICDQLVREAYLFHDGHPAADDITLVVGRVT